MSYNTLKATKESHTKSGLPERKKRGLAVFFLVGALLFVAVAVLGVYSRKAGTAKLQLRADETSWIVPFLLRQPGCVRRRRASLDCIPR